MDSNIRALLIERARKRMPIYYGEIMKKLGLRLGSLEDHAQLSLVLADISRYENKYHRPLLSAIATYSPQSMHFKKGELHGNRFYELAEELGFGKKAKLKKDNFAIRQMTLAQEKWSDPDFYAAHFKLPDDINAVSDGQDQHAAPDFFTQEEIDFLCQWAGQVYDKNDPLHKEAKQHIMDTLGAKTVYWSKRLVEQLQGYETFNWRMWSQKGWADTPEGRKQVARYKHYTWARIYKKGDAYKDIFFTIGVDAPQRALVYKLEYYFEKNSMLSRTQQELCRQIIPTEVSWLTVPYTSIPDYDWDKLISLTADFIRQNDGLYDDIVRCVWENSADLPQLTDRLVKRELPPDGFDEISPAPLVFNGADVDWEQQNAALHAIGQVGEELVITYERKLLEDEGRLDLAAKVCKQPDGVGYDILSFDKDGNEKKIEVKTTTGGPDIPFPITLHEILFSEIHPQGYFLYRLFNLHVERKVAEFHCFSGPLKKHFLLNGIVFNAYRKHAQ